MQLRARPTGSVVRLARLCSASGASGLHYTLINIEEREIDDSICREALERIKVEVNKMTEEHRQKSIRDYLDEAGRRHISIAGSGTFTTAGMLALE